MSAPARVLIASSDNWSKSEIASDSLNAALALLKSPISGSTLLHGAQTDGHQVIARESQKLGLNTEAPPVQWSQLLQGGADLCLVFPTHGYALAAGANPAATSRDTWKCAEEAKAAGIPTIVVWGTDLFPFGQPAAEMLSRDAASKRLKAGPQGQLSIIDAWLPF